MRTQDGAQHISSTQTWEVPQSNFPSITHQISSYNFQGSGEEEASYTDSLTDLAHMRKWLNDKANPLVREITFDNGEELTEEGLPFLLLFYKPGDSDSIQKFKNAVERELLHERRKIIFKTFIDQSYRISG